MKPLKSGQRRPALTPFFIGIKCQLFTVTGFRSPRPLQVFAPRGLDPKAFGPVLTYPACFLCILLSLMKIEDRYYPESPVSRRKPPAHNHMQ